MKQLLNGILVEMTDEQIAEYFEEQEKEDAVAAKKKRKLNKLDTPLAEIIEQEEK